MKNLVRDEGTFWREKRKYYKNVKENYIEREERGTKQVEIDTSGTRIYDYKNVYCLCFFYVTPGEQQQQFPSFYPSSHSHILFLFLSRSQFLGNIGQVIRGEKSPRLLSLWVMRLPRKLVCLWNDLSPPFPFPSLSVFPLFFYPLTRN